jgi:hypothetical protein
VVHIRVPAGAKVFEGFAGPQGNGYLGGGPQFLLPKRLPAWEI